MPQTRYFYNMALIKTVRGWTPKIGKNCYLAENATIVGDVEIGDSVSIGHNAVIHGAKIHNRVLVGIGAIIYSTQDGIDNR